MDGGVRVGLRGFTMAFEDYVREYRLVEVQQTFYESSCERGNDLECAAILHATAILFQCPPRSGQILSLARGAFDRWFCVRHNSTMNRRGRPSLDRRLAVDSPRVAVRVPWRIHRVVSARAASEGRTISEVVRELLEGYAGGGVSSVTAADRREIRRLLRMSDREREDYYLASLRNIERLTA